MAWETATAQRTQHIAEDAARRAGMTLEQWLGEAIVVHAAHENVGDGTQSQASPSVGERVARPEPTLGDEAEAIPPADERRPPAAQDLLEAAIRRIERGLARNAEETLRTLGSIKLPAEPSSAKPPNPVDPRLAGAAPAAPATGNGRSAGPAPPAFRRAAAALSGDQRLDENLAQTRGPASELKLSLKADTAPPRVELKDAVSQIARRRHELDARSASDRLSYWRADPETGPGQAEKARAAASQITAPGRDETGADIRDSPIEPAQAPEVRPVWKASRGDIRALERKLDHLSRTSAEFSAGAAGIVTMRAEIAEIRRSLADLAPRNAIVALEGAIRDLSQRVEVLRQNGHRETLLAPLQAMAEEMRATLKAHDPQAVAAILEREIRSIGAKIDSLGQSAVNPETFERIRAQTEEVRNLLAAAATRAVPSDRLERQIGELADRVERLGASATPHLEIHQMATSFADFRREFERCTPLPALVSVERRLEGIAARLDQEIARPVQPAFDARPFDDLARRIEGVREAVVSRAEEPRAEADRLEASVRALSAKLENQPAGPFTDLIQDINTKLSAVGQRDGATPLAEQLLAQIVDKLDRLPQAISPAPPTDMRPLEEAIRALGEKLDRAAAPSPVPVAAAALDGDTIESLADAVALRFPDRTTAWAGIGPQAVVSELADIHDKVDALSVSSDRSEALEPLVRQLLARLQDSGTTSNETQTTRLDTVAAELSEMRAERVEADRSAELRLSGLQDVLESLVDRLSGLPSRGAADESQSRAPTLEGLSVRPLTTWPGGSAKAGATSQTAPGSFAEPAAARADRDDFLLEPGAGAPKRAQEGRDAAPAKGQRTSPGVSAHIAAARRAAQALADGIAGSTPAAGETTADVPFTPKPLYVKQKRFLLLAVVLAVTVAAAIRLGGPRLPSVQKPEPAGGAGKSATIGPSSRVFDFTGAKIELASHRPGAHGLDQRAACASQDQGRSRIVGPGCPARSASRGAENPA